MREVDQLVPVVRGQLLLFLLYRRAGRDGAITRENPLPQEVGGVGVRMVLEVAIGEPRGDAPRERRNEILDLQDLHLALHLHPRREAQPDGRDHAEQPVPADRESKQLGVLLATAGAGGPSASTSTNDSTSLMNGLNLRPRPWAFAASAPPILKRSAPVCFWRMPHARAAPCCA